MKSFRFITIVSALLIAAAAQAQTVMIRHAQVYTMDRQGTLDNTDVLIAGGRIQQIGKDLALPQGDAKVIDAAGRPLTPGFFAGIGSIGIEEVSAVEPSVDSGLALKEMRPEFDVTTAYNPNSSLVPVTRIEGFTFTLLGAGASGTIIGGQGRVVELDGGYRSFIGNPVLYVNVGRDASKLSGNSRAGQWMLLNQALAEAQKPPAANEARLMTRNGQKTLAEYTKKPMKTVFNADRASDILEVLRFAEKHGLNPVISGGNQAWMVAQQLAAAGVPVLLDPLADLPINFDDVGSRMDNAALLAAAGVVVAVSGDDSHNARKQRQMAGNAVSYGLPHEAGLAALTSNPADIFDVGDRQGHIRRGMPANVVLWSGDPLEVTSAADLVIINGKPEPMVSRQTKLRDRYLQRNPAMPRAYIKP